MKILHKSKSVLRARLSRPWIAILITVLFVMICFGLGPVSVQLEGSKTAPGVARFQIEKSWFGIAFSDRTIEGVIGAEVQTSAHRDHDTHSNRTSYRAALKTSSSLVPVTVGYTGGSGRDRKLVSQVKQFLADPAAESISLNLPGFWILTVIGVFILFLMIALLLNQVDCTLDRAARRVTIQRRGIFGRGVFSFDLGEVKQFTVEQKMSGGSSSGRLYRLALKLKDGGVFPVGQMWSSGWRSKRAEADQLTGFLTAIQSSALDSAAAGAGHVENLKICAFCGQDCSDAPRVKHAADRYYHRSCYEAASGRLADLG